MTTTSPSRTSLASMNDTCFIRSSDIPVSYNPRVLSSQTTAFKFLSIKDAGVPGEGLNPVCEIMSGPHSSPSHRRTLSFPLMNIAVTFPLEIHPDAAISSFVVLHGILGDARAAFTVRAIRHDNVSIRNGLLDGSEYKISCLVDLLQGFAFFVKIEAGLYKGPQSLAFATFDYGSVLIDIYRAGWQAITHITQFCMRTLLEVFYHWASNGGENEKHAGNHLFLPERHRPPGYQVRIRWRRIVFYTAEMQLREDNKAHSDYGYDFTMSGHCLCLLSRFVDSNHCRGET
ncbi:hypothetical protein EW145_g4959 [Phellinidium pouzarii]|uniref:Uncharacterized protein n=1 Tax=Phellinidium pouzarii TaxID=167371 RepID=A0A4S4L1X3_9AGAM|nr:hypothetical protein EW145_g4959 [Phellinidium pouzarii]